LLTRDDIIDLILGHLFKARGARIPYTPASGRPRGRHFLSEHVIKKMLTPQARHLTIPKESIISPLALDWLILKGIKIIRE
jgi:hypothetical protein